MNRYRTSTPRVAFALAAVALTAMTLGLSVIVPAHVDASKTGAPTTIAVSDAPTRVATTRYAPRAGRRTGSPPKCYVVKDLGVGRPFGRPSPPQLSRRRHARLRPAGTGPARSG